MSQNINSKFSNFKASIEKYIHENIVVEEGLRVDFEGTPFEVVEEVEWINEALILTQNRDYHRGVGINIDGQTVEVILNFNIFVNKESTNKTNRTYEIRDILAKYFYVNKVIPIYDFSNDDFVDIIQNVKIRDIYSDNAILDERKYFLYNYAVTIDWLETWNK